MDHGHAGFVAERPQGLGRTADADLDGALGIQHAVLDGDAERAAMVVLVAEQLRAGIAMGVEMDHAERPVGGNRLHDRQGDRVVAAAGQRAGCPRRGPFCNKPRYRRSPGRGRRRPRS